MFEVSCLDSSHGKDAAMALSPGSPTDRARAGKSAMKRRLFVSRNEQSPQKANGRDSPEEPELKEHATDYRHHHHHFSQLLCKVATATHVTWARPTHCLSQDTYSHV